jgi:hypothetical protein
MWIVTATNAVTARVQVEASSAREAEAVALELIQVDPGDAGRGAPSVAGLPRLQRVLRASGGAPGGQ